MKKTALVIVSFLIVFSLCACNQKATSEVHISEEDLSVVESVEETAENVVESVEPEHIFVIKDMGDGTHAMYCKEFDETKDIEAHTFVDGKCSVCGYECKHENVDYKSEDSTESFKHTSICNDCGLNLSEECVATEEWICEKCGRDMRYLVIPIEQQTLYSAVSYSKRDLPSMSESEVIGKYEVNDEVTIVGEVLSYKEETDKFYQTDDGAFIKYEDNYLSAEKIKPADPHNVSYANSPVPNYPSSIDGYDLTTMYDDGDTFYMYKPATNHYVKSVDSSQYGKWFGALQREAEAAYIDRGHGYADWHIETITSEVNKWYLADY